MPRWRGRDSPASPTLIGRTSTPSEGAELLHRAELARPSQCTESLKERHLLHARSDLFEQLQPFRADAIFVQHKTSSVAARPGERLHETGADRFADLRENDRHGTLRPSIQPDCASSCASARRRACPAGSSAA